MNKIRKAVGTLMLMSSANAVGIRGLFGCCHRRQEGAPMHRRRIEQRQLDNGVMTRVIEGNQETRTIFPRTCRINVPILNAHLNALDIKESFVNTGDDGKEYTTTIIITSTAPEGTRIRALEILASVQQRKFVNGVEENPEEMKTLALKYSRLTDNWVYAVSNEGSVVCDAITRGFDVMMFENGRIWRAHLPGRYVLNRVDQWIPQNRA